MTSSLSRRLTTSLALLALCLWIPAAALAERNVVAPEAAVLDLPFSPAVWNGGFLVLSGALANDPGTTNVSGDTAEQTRKTLNNLKVVLEAAGLGFEDVVQVDGFLSDIRHQQAYDAVYQEVMGQTKPVHTLIEADIAIPAALTEIAMVALKKDVERRAINPQGWKHRPGLSYGILADNTLLMSGMGPFDPTTGQLVPGNAEEQVRRTMENIGQVLATVNMKHDDIVSCNVFLPDARDFPSLNKIYPQFYRQSPPARATVRARTTHPDAKVEIQCTAVQHHKRRAVLPEGGKPRYTLSPSIEVVDRLFLSGMVGRNAEGVFPPDVAQQTQVVLDNLAATLKSAGLTFDDVTDARVFLTDIRHYAAMNEVYAAAVGKPAPARATVGTVLMTPDALVEIQMNARRTPDPEPETSDK